ncbi:MAG: M14 family metallopeptidase, partial [Gemmatimonadales bacterium]
LPFPLDVYTPGITGYDAVIPTHEAVFGHVIGSRHTRPDQIVSYVAAVALASDRVVMGHHGTTYEGRPLVHALVTSPANHARLEELRLANARISDDPGSVTDANLAGMPTIVYLGYSVHGNEASGSEAALLTLYYLAAAQGEGVDRVLDNTVIVLDPLLNPDGRDRFVDWVNRNRGRVATSDSADREHNEPWPNGRTNHYLFDLNRDWLPGQLPESQGRLELFHSWRPQLHTDHHEMGGSATFFFMPGIPARNNPNTPQATIDLTGRIAQYHADYLDEIGSLYYSEESYDDFYYGKGSTYPDVNGAVGILFEQASSRALLAETRDGPLPYVYTVRNHFSASLSTLQAAVELRQELLRNQREFYADASDFARSTGITAWVFGSAAYPTRTKALVEMLLRHRIEVHELARPITVGGRSFDPRGAYIVPLEQAQARLINAMMADATEFSDSLFYDVSAWTMGHAFGVPHAAFNRNPSGLLGGPVDAVAPDAGAVVGNSDYAYVFEWGRYFAPRALYELQVAGVDVRLMSEPFTAMLADGSSRNFARGSIVVPVGTRDGSGPNRSELRSLLQRLAARDELVFYAVGTGLTPQGVDLGARSSSALELPSVALVAGSGTSNYQVGEAWHLLNERMGVPVSLIDLDEVVSIDLDRYNTIVLAGVRRLQEGTEAALDEWVSGGGTLIAVGSAVSQVIDAELVEAVLEERPEVGDGSTRYADRRQITGAQRIGGSIFSVTLDTTHPLAYGHPERMAVFKNNQDFLIASDDPGTNVARYSGSRPLSGYLSEEMAGLVDGKVPIMALSQDDGRVVLFTDDPNFRAFWLGTNGLFLNAVFFGRSF